MRVRVAIWSAVLLAVFFGAHQIYLRTHPHLTRAEKVASHPMPPLFGQDVVAPYARGMDRQAVVAARLMRGWWGSHGTVAHDRQFVAWLEGSVPAAPASAARKAEAAALEKLVQDRAPSAVKAASWLQTFAGRDLWAFYEQKQSNRLPKSEQKTLLRELARMQRMSAHAGKTLDKRMQQPAPFLLDPALRPGHHPRPGATCPCSYPAPADAVSAASRTFLTYRNPQQAALYDRMTGQLGYAQVLMGNHLPSDVDAGALVGDMVGEYFLVTRGQASPSQVTAAVGGQ